MPPTRRRPVAMVVHAYYEEDPRVRREAESLVAAGRPVDVFALRAPAADRTATVDGVRVTRLDVQRHQGAGIGTYLAEYAEFLVRALFAVAAAHRHRRYALVQIHTLPDALVLAALPERLAGVPVVIDLHEATPEFFRMRFPGAANPLVHGLLVVQERVSVALADAAITVNDALADRLVGMGVPAEKVTVVRNSASLARFDPTRRPDRGFMADGVLRLVYAGGLSPVYELDVVLAALVRLRSLRPTLAVTLDLYGREFGEVPLRDRAAALGVADSVAFHGRIAIEDVPGAITRADVGLAPTRRTEFTDFSLSTKIFEYAAMRKPVVASRLPMVVATFGPTVWSYVPGDANDLARAILELVDGPAERDARVTAALAVVETLAWERESARYLALIERLLGD